MDRQTITHDGYIFELIDYIPYGYEIWNIGTNMLEGYLPLCRLSSRQPFPGGRAIDVDTLKAIKTDGAQKILAVVASGINTLEAMEKYLQKHKSPNPKTWEYIVVKRIKEALPFMKMIKGA